VFFISDSISYWTTTGGLKKTFWDSDANLKGAGIGSVTHFQVLREFKLLNQLSGQNSFGKGTVK